MKTNWRTAVVMGVLMGLGSALNAQTANTQAPAAEPQAPKPARSATEFPPANPKNFTAASPTRDEVDAFLHALWGYDDNRLWSVAGIQKTTAPGISLVQVLVADKSQPGKLQPSEFLTTPDGKHAIVGLQVMDFGAKPWEDTRKVLMERANGPSRGAKSKDLELVEFADLQCPHCKEAEERMNDLANDFPQARIVFENLPLEMHPYAFRAAAEGECVRKAKGDDAFFVYTKTVFDKQDSLTPELVEETLATAAAAAGANAQTVAACAKTPEVAAEVNASAKLADDLGVTLTPTLAVNGYLLPLNAFPYEVLKRIVAWHAQMDGVSVTVQPTLSTLK